MSDNHNEAPENCTHDCSTCGEACAQHEPESLQQPLRPGSRVDKVIAVVSGKGGVGKSLVTSLLACEMQRRGHQAAVLDADITGPSIPQAFGVHGGAMGGEDFLYANRTRTGIEIMSINLLLPNETDPVVWRGPVIAGAVTQFWTDVQWDNVNYMFVDMPPGTGDVPLTVFQSLPVAGVVVVTSPQELVGMIVDKAVNMADMMHVPVLGIVENMAYYTCPDCGKQHAIFGESHIEAIAAKHGIPNTAKLPIDPRHRGGVRRGPDRGRAGRLAQQPRRCHRGQVIVCITKTALHFAERFFCAAPKPRRVSPPERRKKVRSFSPATCASEKILLRLQVWNLCAAGGQIMRAAGCRPFVGKPGGFPTDSKTALPSAERFFDFTIC